jgi:low temperature requirement protein LtrA
VLWWWYFDGAGAAEERQVRSHRDGVRFHLWSYAHFPLALGIVVLGVGIERAVSAASHAQLDRGEMLIMTGAAALVFAMLAALAALAPEHKRPRRSVISGSLAVAILLPVLGAVAAMTSPVLVIAIVFVAAGGLLAFHMGVSRDREQRVIG